MADPTLRPEISREILQDSLDALEKKMEYRLGQHGRGAYASKHEALGIIAEEQHELVEAVQSNNLNDIHDELLDVAVGCLFAVACIRQGVWNKTQV